MLSEVSFDTLIEWMVFAELEPFDEWREDMRNANVVSAIFHAFSKRKKPLRDFMLKFGDTHLVKRQQTWQEMMAIGRSLAKVSEQKKKRPKAKRG